jgi:predicted ATP-grasp superfamily ATP-dependent carboligase
MRVFVYEYLCSGALAGSTGTSLHTEGWAMLSAVLEDFGRCPDVEIVTLLDSRLAPPPGTWPSNIVHHPLRSGTEERTFRAHAAAADYSLVIAPEFDDILAQRCRWVEEEGGRLLGPSSAAVRLTSDKLTLACHWRAHGVPTPVVLEPPSRTSPTSLPYPLVLKPRHGAGSQATFLVHNASELAHSFLRAGAEGWSSELILQPYVPGLPVSVAFLVGLDRLLSLTAVEQHLSKEGRFHYLGGRLPLAEELDHRARRLAVRAVRTVEGLHGYFGVDLVLGEAADGSADVVIEINPRLTTSYVGLRRLARFNLAEALLAVAAGAAPSDWRWRTESIAFEANGRVSP